MDPIVYELTQKAFKPTLSITTEEVDRLIRFFHERGYFGPPRTVKEIRLNVRQKRRIVSRFPMEFEQRLRARCGSVIEDVLLSALGKD